MIKNNNKNILVYGLGVFWYAILKHLDINKKNYNLSGFIRNNKTCNFLNENKSHPEFHRDHKFSNYIKFYCNYEEAVKDADIIVLCVTSSVILNVLKDIKHLLKKDVILLNTAKALSGEWNTYSLEIKKILENINYNYAILSWWTIAEDLFLWYPLWATIAWSNKKITKKLSKIFKSKNLYIEKSSDVIWTEYAWTFKNIGSILAWYLHWKQYPYWTETFYLTQFAWEVSDLCVKYLWSKSKTFSMNSQCFWNDYWMSCTWNTRNRAFGVLLWEWKDFDKAVSIMKSQNHTAEWVNTLNSLNNLFNKHNINKSKFPLLSNLLKLKTNEFDLNF